MAKSKVAKFKKRRKAARSAKKNPAKGEITELGTRVGAGFAGYTLARLVSRVAYAQAIKKFPNHASHAAVVASVASTAAAYYGTSKWDKIADYHDEITIGAGIALFQQVVQTYLPQYSWIVGDLSADQYKSASQKAKEDAAKNQSQIVSSVPSLPGIPDEVPDQPRRRGPEMGSEGELADILAEAGFEESDTVGQLPPAAGPDFEDLDLDGLGFGSLGGGGDGLGDYSESHGLH